MEINFFRENVEIDIDEARMSEWVTKIIEEEECMPGEISVIFCDDGYLLDMNKEHLDHDYYTDIITFDYVVGDLISGDLFISIDRVAENAKENNVTYEREMHRVIIHGVLHLLTYDDHKEEDIAEMREMEESSLATLDAM